MFEGERNLDEWGDVFRGKVGLNCCESVMKCKRTGESNGMTLKRSRFSFFFLGGGGGKDVGEGQRIQSRCYSTIH